MLLSTLRNSTGFSTKCTKSVFTNIKIWHFPQLECLTAAQKRPQVETQVIISLFKIIMLYQKIWIRAGEDPFRCLPLFTFWFVIGNAVAAVEKLIILTQSHRNERLMASQYQSSNILLIFIMFSASYL